jgi:hypothetical protein
MKLRSILLIAALWMGIVSVGAANPMSTAFDARQCDGSLMPYPREVTKCEYPDSLVPVFINHVGRHGSRYPVSSTFSVKMQQALNRADSLGTITPLGREFMSLNDAVLSRCANQWGALDSLGMAEQRAIASRMFFNYTPLFSGKNIVALSSYSPRSMMSMFVFTNQIDRLNNHNTITTSTGRVNSQLMRPFDLSQEYKDFRSGDAWTAVYDEYVQSCCPTTAVARLLGEDFPYEDADDWRDLAINEYYVTAGLDAIQMEYDPMKYYTQDELNCLWSCFNLRQYLQRVATTVSTVPADIAGDLLQDLITTTEEFVDGKSDVAVRLRFGHGETLLPLLSLLHLQGCYYLTNYFDTVAQHWQDFNIIPMSANLQLVLFKAKKSGRYYLRVDLNERPMELVPNSDTVYTPWTVARDYMMRCLPLYI